MARVCVSGAAGYIGSYVVQALVEQGHEVRPTVRDPTKTRRVAHLREMGVEPFAADLLTAGSFDEAVAGCDFVVHTASPVRSKADDPEAEIVRPAVEGTRNVLEAARRAGTVRRVVVTSSSAAVIDGALDPAGRVFSESDWNESATVDTAPYDVSKREAERLAERFVEALPPEERFELVVLNPTLVLGPLLAPHHIGTSPGIVRDLMAGKYPLAPDFTFGIVDVRDLALAHVRALTLAKAAPRYLCTNESRSLPELGRMLRRIEPACRAPIRKMPTPMMYGVALFDRRISLSFVRRNLGKRRRLDNARFTRDLARTLRRLEATVADTAADLVQRGLVQLQRD